MRKETAVEWLIDQLFKNGYFDGNKPLTFINLEQLQQQAILHEKKWIVKNITDYNKKVTEFLHNPLFNLEHSKHGIACEKLADIRNQFINEL